MNNPIVEKITSKIERGDNISPFLFLGSNMELLNADVKTIALEVLKYFEIPSTYLFTLEDNWEKIKISEVKRFFEQANLNTPYKVQIFFIENLWRMTISAANSCLKVFEEPWKTNIIFWSNVSESMVIDTILSRMQVVSLWKAITNKKDEFYFSMISSYVNDNSPEILSYFFRNKLEKEDYIRFLENLVLYAKENLIFIDFLDEINDDLNMIATNNVNAKWVVDKWLLKIK